MFVNSFDVPLQYFTIYHSFLYGGGSILIEHFLKSDKPLDLQVTFLSYLLLDIVHLAYQLLFMSPTLQCICCLYMLTVHLLPISPVMADKVNCIFASPSTTSRFCLFSSFITKHYVYSNMS